jgi:predicted lipoprotein with Yx(FWY)xxD motif
MAMSIARQADGKPDRPHKPRRRAAVLVLLPLTVALGVAGFVAAGSIAQSSTGTGATVSLGKTKLGRVLVNSKGHTLYLFKKDKSGKSTCSGSCATFWRPLLAHGKASLGPGVKRSMLGTTRRSDGSRQLTYNHHPLYTFALDKHSGQTNGEGLFEFGAKWYAVSARGNAVDKDESATTTATTATNTCPYPPC